MLYLCIFCYIVIKIYFLSWVEHRLRSTYAVSTSRDSRRRQR